MSEAHCNQFLGWLQTIFASLRRQSLIEFSDVEKIEFCVWRNRSKAYKSAPFVAREL